MVLLCFILSDLYVFLLYILFCFLLICYSNRLKYLNFFLDIVQNWYPHFFWLIMGLYNILLVINYVEINIRLKYVVS